MSKHCRSSSAGARSVLARGCGLLLALALLVACGNGQTSAPTAEPPPPTATSVPPTPTLAADQFVNPVIDRDFPDPDILKVGERYYAYATNTGTVTIQVAVSDNLVDWEMLDNALPVLPMWARPVNGLTWAPEVAQFADQYVMYFTSRDEASDKQCIGVATSPTPEGPFTADDAQALICQAEQGGSIDASTFVDDDGTPYILWKNDGNCCGQDTWLYIQQLSPDGLALVGEPTQLIKQDQVWEGNLVEGPTLWKHGDAYYLFYSANNYAGPDYAIGYAVAEHILGPYTKPSSTPFLSTDYQGGAAIGPGGQDIVLDGQQQPWIVFHSWNSTGSYRAMHISRIVWNDRTPTALPLTKGPQTRPAP